MELGEPTDSLQELETSELRLRCRAAELNVNGTTDSMIGRLRQHYTQTATTQGSETEHSGTVDVEQLQQQLQDLQRRLEAQERAAYVEAVDDNGAPLGTQELSEMLLKAIPQQADAALIPPHERLRILRKYPAPNNYELYGAKFESFELEKMNKEARTQEKMLRDIQQRSADALCPMLQLLRKQQQTAAAMAKIAAPPTGPGRFRGKGGKGGKGFGSGKGKGKGRGRSFGNRPFKPRTDAPVKEE
jgi:hypothetical protein